MSVDLQPRPPRVDALMTGVKVVPTAVGGFYASSMETVRCMGRRPFHAREFVHQAVARRASKTDRGTENV